MARVALIFPYFRTHAITEMLFPPLGLAALKGHLRSLGVEARIFDGTFSTPQQLLGELRSYEPDIAGIYSMVSLSKSAFAIALEIRAALPQVILAAGGPLPTLYPDRYSRAFDVVFRGEADTAFPRFCADVLAAGLPRGRLAQLPLASYPGLHLRGVADNPVCHYSEEELASFPLPDRGDFDHASYQREWRALDGTRTSSIMTSLGCPHGCDFCSKPVYGNLFRRRSLDTVFQEIAELRRLGYDTLWIADDSFTLSHAHLQAFCERIAGTAMRWSCLSRVNGMTPDITRMMKEAGCHRVYLGLESGSDETLRLMKKQTTVAQGVETVGRYRDAGIEVAGFFLVGYPGESVQSIEETFRLAGSLPLDYISFNVPYPLPGSSLFERVGGALEGQDWSEENEVSFVYRSEFDQEWLKRRIGEVVRQHAERQHAERQHTERQHTERQHAAREDAARHEPARPPAARPV